MKLKQIPIKTTDCTVFPEKLEELTWLLSDSDWMDLHMSDSNYNNEIACHWRIIFIRIINMMQLCLTCL